MHLVSHYYANIALVGLKYLESFVIYQVSDIVEVVGHLFNYLFKIEYLYSYIWSALASAFPIAKV